MKEGARLEAVISHQLCRKLAIQVSRSGAWLPDGRLYRIGLVRVCSGPQQTRLFVSEFTTYLAEILTSFEGTSGRRHKSNLPTTEQADREGE